LLIKTAKISQHTNNLKLCEKIIASACLLKQPTSSFEFVEAIIIIVAAKCHCQSCSLSKFINSKLRKEENRGHRGIEITSVLLFAAVCVHKLLHKLILIIN
jgi:hypothetical protein